jgi:pilus assembly protein CpaB
LGISLGAGFLAWNMFSNLQRPQIVQQQVVQNIDTTEVLVVKNDLGMGSNVTVGDIGWQEWPSAAASSAQMIKRREAPNAVEEISGSIVRTPFIAGEPVRRDKLIKGANAGFMSAILPSGRRALAINIDAEGGATAGNFILPNDRVDVIRTFRPEDSSRAGQGESFVSETVLQNVRVLAIGQRLEERGGEKIVTGRTATLELEPRQVEIIALAQRTGQLSLALRSMLDANKPSEVKVEETLGSMTVVRYGVSQTHTPSK